MSERWDDRLRMAFGFSFGVAVALNVAALVAGGDVVPSAVGAALSVSGLAWLDSRRACEGAAGGLRCLRVTDRDLSGWLDQHETRLARLEAATRERIGRN